MKKFDRVMIESAVLWSKMSYCKRLKVGAVLSSKDGRILATGYNGSITGYINLCEKIKKIEVNDLKDKENINKKNIIVCRNCNGYGSVFKNYYPYTVEEKCKFCDGTGYVQVLDETNEFTLHAEQNIISFCAKNGISMKETILYVTHSPCKQCMKLLIQSGVKEIVYKEFYKDDSAIEFAKNFDVIVRQF